MSNSVDLKINTRLLLMLWDLGGSTEEIKKTDLINSVKKSKETVAVYQPALDELNEKGAIAIAMKNRSLKISLTDIGLEILEAGLKSPEFESNARQPVRAKEFNAVLRWLRHANFSTKDDIAHFDLAIALGNVSNLRGFSHLGSYSSGWVFSKYILGKIPLNTPIWEALVTAIAQKIAYYELRFAFKTHKQVESVIIDL